MAHRKAGGTAKNLRDSQPKYLGTKVADGQRAYPGSIIIRQRGTPILPGTNTSMGKDHTIFAMKEGIVKFGSKRKTSFNGKTKVNKVVNVIA